MTRRLAPPDLFAGLAVGSREDKAFGVCSNYGITMQSRTCALGNDAWNWGMLMKGRAGAEIDLWWPLVVGLSVAYHLGVAVDPDRISAPVVTWFEVSPRLGWAF